MEESDCNSQQRRLVAKGYASGRGIDLNKSFAPCCSLGSSSEFVAPRSNTSLSIYSDGLKNGIFLMVYLSRRFMLLTRRQLLEDTVSLVKSCKPGMSKKQNCTAMSSASRVCGVICKLCTSNLEEDTLQDYAFNTTEYRLYSDTQSAISNIMQTPL
ncbi:hypothetical protein Tco_0110597 [Tanacetum coccineum]